MNVLHRRLAACAATLAFAAALVDAGPRVDPSDLAAEIAAQRDHMPALDLAERIAARAAALVVFDLRTADEYERFHIPSAVHVTLDELTALTLARDTTVVLYSDGGTDAAQGWMLLRLRGHRNAFFLRDGIYEWIARVHEPRLAIDATPAEREVFERAATLSRFFGGQPRADVPRHEVPAGYWTGGAGQATPQRAASAIAAIRRRGC